MDNTQLEQLMQQADQAAKQENWEDALTHLSQVLEINPNDIGAITGAGTCLLRLGRPGEAIPKFQKAVRLSPESPDSHNNLGVAYLVAGYLDMAEAACKEALWYDDDNVQAWKNLAQIYLQQKDRLTEGVQILASVVQAHPDDTDALIQLGLCYEIGGDLESARLMFQRALEIQPDLDLPKKLLEDMLDTEQVFDSDLQRIARPEHAKKLAGLKTLVRGNAPAPAAPQVNFAVPRAEKTAALYVSEEFTGSKRAPSLARFFAGRGVALQAMESFSLDHLDRFDSFVFYNPNLSASLVDAVNQCIQKGKQYMLDLDLDFHSIPFDHPAYAQFGPGNVNALRAVEIMLGDAELLTAASETLLERYRQYTRNAQVVAPAWSNDNPWWDRPTPERATVNIGWLGSAADFPELKALKEPIGRFLGEHPETIWAAAGNEDAYTLFSELPEERRLFLPPPTSESLAFLLSNFDILLAPWNDNRFNQARSDQQLLHAGIRRIPWVASPIRSFIDWKEGGFIATTENDWYNQLSKLAGSAELRQQMGDAGRRKAETRRAN